MSFYISADWSAVPHFDGPPLPVKVSLPIGPLQLKIDGHDISSLEMLIKEDPDHPALDPTSALRNVRVAFKPHSEIESALRKHGRVDAHKIADLASGPHAVFIQVHDLDQAEDLVNSLNEITDVRATIVDAEITE